MFFILSVNIFLNPRPYLNEFAERTILRNLLVREQNRWQNEQINLENERIKILTKRWVGHERWTN